MSHRTKILPLYVLITSLFFLLIQSPTFAQYAYLELTWANGEFTYTTNNTDWSSTMYTYQSIIGTTISNPSWNKCSGDVLVMPVGALVTSRYFYISETSNIFIRRGLTISQKTTSITVQVQGTNMDHVLGDFWVGTDEVSNTGNPFLGNETCQTGTVTIPSSWFTTNQRIKVLIGYEASMLLSSTGGVKKVRLTFNGWIVSAPSAPTATAATNVASNSFKANWNSVSGATGYRLDVATNSTFTNYVSGYQNLDVGDVTNKNVSGLIPGRKYYYRVRAYNSIGSSDNSNTITVNTILSVPTATAATNVASNSFRANWNSVSSATGYRLDVATNSTFTNYVSGYQNLDVGNVTYKNVSGLISGTTYYYRVRAYNSIGSSANSNTITVGPLTHIQQIPSDLPLTYDLSQNYPNPFNPSTTISYQIPSESFVTLKVFDLLGRELEVLVNEEKTAGFYDVKYNASSLSSGIYFYTIRAGDFIQTKKFILLK